jgi:hypothetical protein
LELSPNDPALVTPIRLTVTRLAVPPGEVRIISRSPTNECVRVRSTATPVRGAVLPDTAKLIVNGVV